jgi:hypothetical protein
MRVPDLSNHVFEEELPVTWSNPVHIQEQMAAVDAQERMLRTKEAWMSFARLHNCRRMYFLYRYPRPVYAFDAVSGFEERCPRKGTGFKSPCLPFGHKWYNFLKERPHLKNQFTVGLYENGCWKVVNAAYVIQQFFRRLNYKRKMRRHTLDWCVQATCNSYLCNEYVAADIVSYL